jgi:hypothetical protein
MNWFRSHLNWTIILFIALWGIVVIGLQLIGYTNDSALMNIMVLVLGIASFFVFGWVLKRKNRRMWWLLLNLTGVGWIVLLAMGNKTRYDVVEREKIRDLLKFMAHIDNSVGLALGPLQSTVPRGKVPRHLRTIVENAAMRRMQPKMQGVIDQIEMIRQDVFNTYQWPTVADSEASGLISEIKTGMNGYLDCELKGLHLGQELKEDSALTQEMNATSALMARYSKQNRKNSQKLAERYHFSSYEIQQLVAEA